MHPVCAQGHDLVELPTCHSLAEACREDRICRFVITENNNNIISLKILELMIKNICRKKKNQVLILRFFFPLRHGIEFFSTSNFRY